MFQIILSVTAKRDSNHIFIGYNPRSLR